MHSNIYIYIYRERERERERERYWVQVTSGITLSNVTPLNRMQISTNLLLNYIIFVYSPYLQNFKIIKD